MMQATMMRLRAASSFAQGLKWAVKRSGAKAFVLRPATLQVSLLTQRPAATASLSVLVQDHRQQAQQAGEFVAILWSSIFGLGYLVTQCDSSSSATKGADHLTPADVGREDLEDVVNSHDVDSLPVYSLGEVAQRNGEDGTRIWMTYGGIIYDVTDFVENHPGGSEKIMAAAGSAIEPYW